MCVSVSVHVCVCVCVASTLVTVPIYIIITSVYSLCHDRNILCFGEVELKCESNKCTSWYMTIINNAHVCTCMLSVTLTLGIDVIQPSLKEL